jgi:hypothetical protein
MSEVRGQEGSSRLCLSAMISLLSMRTFSTISSRMSSTMYRANSSSEMSSPSTSSLKSYPCKPPPLEKFTSKSNFTRLSVVGSSPTVLTSVLAAPSLAGIIRRRRGTTSLSTNLVEGRFSEVRLNGFPCSSHLHCSDGIMH